ncbi:hypothetical protein PGT21_008835 [Puccinia graminis f. sp. tritici]|uniref:Uncharacterized protein n=1 Tax=Puccinia graminis f. sp. tritici TaxID=56615 RepID=A0A5B0RQM9_PUCGR|nr:hypothetical protein PGT21_008835 [Puccinia graminis f. sp. tritici]KAA1128266.1 hypothetical protein PGTUg99_019386 [Puccinia graminis f. sp. tritici]
MNNAPLWIIEAMVSQGFESFPGTCRRKISAIDGADYPGMRRAPIQQIKARKKHLSEIRKGFLPTLRQLLADLIVAQDLVDPQKEPKYPDVREINRITCRIVDMLREIRYAASTIALTEPQAPEDEDHEYGILKRYRTKALVEKLRYMIRYPLRESLGYHGDFFEQWKNSKERVVKRRFDYPGLLIATATAFHFIDEIIEWLKKSDFGVLQETWKAALDGYEDRMTALLNRLNPTIRSEHERGPASAHSETRLSQSEANNLVGHEEDQLGNFVASDTSPVLPRPRARLLKLLLSVLLLGKLARILFNKLLITPISRPGFTLDSQMSSAQIDYLTNQTRSVFFSIWNLADMLATLYDLDRLENLEAAQHDLDKILGYFDSSIRLLSLHLVPSHPNLQPGLPASENIFKHRFSLLIDQFHLAAQNLTNDLKRFTDLDRN